MMQPHNALRIDQHIAAPLPDIARRFTWQSAVEDLLEIGQPGTWAPNIPEAGIKHSVGPVDIPIRVNKQRPIEAGFLHIPAGQETGLESYYDHLGIFGQKLVFSFPQLREMAPAGQSAEMPVKDHKQPETCIIRKPVHLAGSILKLKRNSGLINEIHFHR
jgi:hypothetical protein